MGKWWHNKLPWENDRASELISALNPLKEEPIITKNMYSAFEQTDLRSYLARQQTDTILVCGVMTHLCVETTVRHAFMLDYQPIVVKDACASETKKHHEATLYNLAHGFAYILSTKEIIGLLKK